MKCAIEHPSPLRRYTLHLNHGGTIDPSSTFLNYKGGKTVIVRDLYMKEASLALYKGLAERLGYMEGFKIYYRGSIDGKYIEITEDLPPETVSSHLSPARVLDIYLLNGVREQIPVEKNPSVLFWNTRGFNDKKVDEVRALNLIYEPNLLFLSETRLTSTFSSTICFKLRFHDFRDSPAKKRMEDIDSCVGLALFWTKDMELECEDGSNNFLECMIKVSESIRYRLICFYGYPQEKILSCKLLKELSDASTEKRLVIGGDLNEILNQDEKSDEIPSSRVSSITNFENALTSCGLKKVPYEGSPFTWIGGSADKPLMEKLDRVVATVSWKDLFTDLRVLHLTDRLSSDHIPILLQTDSENQKIKIRGGNVFSFIAKMKAAYVALTINKDITTVSRMESIVGKERDIYYKAVELVAPHLVQLYDIPVFHKNRVTCERLVTLKGVHYIQILLLNSIDAPKRSRKYDLTIVPQFPSCGISSNLSEYLEETWSLVEFIPKKGNQESREMIVDEIIEKQVTNLITWFDEVRTRDGGHTGNDRKPLNEILGEDASMIGRAVIVFDIIMYQLEKEGIKYEGAITKLEEDLHSACKYYFGELTAEVDSREMIGKPLQYLLNTFQWHDSEDRLQYRIPKISKENYEVLFVQVTIRMLEAERDAVLINHPWVLSYIKNGTDKEKLVEEVCRIKRTGQKTGRRAVVDQLDLLKEIGCISCSKNDEIALCSDDRDYRLVIKRLRKAGSEASKQLFKDNKSLTYKAYKTKLMEAYKKTASNKKREIVRDGGKQDEKKPRN